MLSKVQFYLQEHIRPNPHYFMSVQQELKPEHRQLVVKWILEIVEVIIHSVQ